MASNFNRDNSGTLSANQNKTKDNHPSHRGKATIDGVEYYISAWVKEGQYGRFFSLSFQPVEEANNTKSSKPVNNHGDFDEDIPFN